MTTVHLPKRQLVIKIERQQQFVARPSLALSHVQKLAVCFREIKTVPSKAGRCDATIVAFGAK